MSYKYSSGYQVMGDISGSDDANRNTGIDFEEDAIHLVTNGTDRFKISGSNGAITFNGAYTFPVTDGQNNQVLQTNGSGQLSFANASGGGGGNSLTVVSPKTGNYTASNNEVVPVNLIGASGDVTITLPAASSNAQVVIKISGNAEGKIVTVDGNGSQTIDGSATRTMDSDNESMFLVSDGSNWLRIS
jgi:hypothetical protein